MPTRMTEVTRPMLVGSLRLCVSVVRTGARAPKPMPVTTWPTAATSTNGVPVYSIEPTPTRTRIAARSLSEKCSFGILRTSIEPSMPPMPLTADSQPIQPVPTRRTSR